MQDFLKNNLPKIMEIIEFQKNCKEEEMLMLYEEYCIALKTNAMELGVLEQKIRDCIKAHETIKMLTSKTVEKMTWDGADV